jgi:hypothetical protein
VAKSQRPQPQGTEAIGDLVGGEAREGLQRLDPETLERLDQISGLAVGDPKARAQGLDRNRSPPSGRGEVGGEAGPARGDLPLLADGAPGRRQDPGRVAPVETAETVDREEGLPRPLRLDRRAQLLERPDHRLGRLDGLDRVLKLSAPGPRPPGMVRARRRRQALVDDAGDLHTNICS